jgi:hypothetical protein
MVAERSDVATDPEQQLELAAGLVAAANAVPML